jgi:hypothetical protein
MPIIKIDQCLNCSGKDSPVSHEFLFDGLTLRELRDIKKITGMGQAQFAVAGDEGDPEALAALLWIMHKRQKILIPFDDVDLDFDHFEMILTAEEQVEYDAAMAELEKAKAKGVVTDPKLPVSGISAKAE